MDVRYSRYTVDETLECVWVRWSTDDEADRGLKSGAGVLKEGGLSLE